jgi:hypothetical protein
MAAGSGFPRESGSWGFREEIPTSKPLVLTTEPGLWFIFFWNFSTLGEDQAAKDRPPRVKPLDLASIKKIKKIEKSFKKSCFFGRRLVYFVLYFG